MIFPVKAPYQVTPDISKYQGEIFNQNPDKFYLKQKTLELNRFGDQVLSVMRSSKEAIDTVSNFLDKKILSFKDLALQFEEDIAILRKGVLEAICFCFPSGFIPSEKIGKNFFDIHLPVADGTRLRAASEKVSTLISKEGNLFRRYVWTITSLPGLSQHPSLPRPNPNGIKDLYFRTETQTTVGLSNEICLFLVKVEMNPLESIWQDPSKREMLLASINSMSDETLGYKNLHQIKPILNHQSTLS